jgi:transposase
LEKKFKKMKSQKKKFVPSPPLVGVETNPGPTLKYYLSEEERWGIVTLWKEPNWTQRKIAKKYGVAPSTVKRIIKKYNKTKNVKDLPRSGRKRKISEVGEKNIVKQAKKRKTAPQIAKNLSEKVSVRTIQKTIQNSGLKWLRIIKVDELSRAQEAKRLEYAEEKKDYDYKKVLFSDEKSFWLSSIPSHAWQEPGKRLKVEVPKYAKKLHVWGAMGFYFKSELYFFKENLTGPLYQTIIKNRLQEKKITYSDDCPQRLKKKWIFLQDNDPKHTAKKSMEELKKLVGNRWIKHPAMSPDLNPIEDVWSYLERKLKDKNIKTIAGLKRFLIKEWDQMEWSEIRKSINSMPRRLEECMELKGKRTNY